MLSTALFYAEYGEIVVQTSCAYGIYHPQPWLASLEHQKARRLSKDYFPIVFQSACSHPFQHRSCSKQSITFFFFSFRWRENIFPVYKNSWALLLTHLNEINPG